MADLPVKIYGKLNNGGLITMPAKARSLAVLLLCAGAMPARAVMDGQGHDFFPVTAIFTSSASVLGGQGLLVTYGVKAGTITLTGGITASSGTFTQSGELLYSLQTSSGVNVLAGGVTAPFFAGSGAGLTAVIASSVAANGVRPGSVVAGAIVDADINASAGIAPSKITGTAAVLGANTFTGAQTLPGNPSSALHIVTKQYVDNDTYACPTGMAYIPGPYPYCVDKYEAYLAGGTVTNCTCTNGSQAEVDACGSTAVAGSASGQTPLVSINWCEAKKACQNAGKHLLTNSEWFNAANYKGSKWNITAEENAEAMACNTTSAGAALTGASGGCVTQEGVYDMIGNIWEWVDFVMTADPTNGLTTNGYITGYDFATGIPTSTGASSGAYGNDYYWAYDGGGAPRAAVRGGRWDFGAYAGVFTLVVNPDPSNLTGAFGFRCGRKK